MQYYFAAWRRIFDFSGRASRKDYWYFILFSNIIYIITSIVDISIFGPNGNGALLAPIAYIVHFIPSLSVSFRRLHDTDRSAWWLLGAVLIFPIVFFFFRGTQGSNRFGPDPYGNVALDPAGPSPSARAVIPSAAGASVVEELERLSRLRSEGHLSEAEYEVMKSSAIGRVI